MPDLAYIAGLIEGEGCFQNPNEAAGYRGVRITVVSTDRDVLAKIKRLIGAGNIRLSRAACGNRKDCFHYNLAGDQARWLMGLLYPHMGTRRRKAIRGLYTS